MLDIAQGKVTPQENDTLVTDPYRVYQLKHNLIDIRKHQYYLKDAYKPTLHFQNLDHPKTQFYDWSGDSFYWMPYDKWKERVEHSYTSRISTNLEDYETRGEGDTLEVKWVVCHHTFDWEDYRHVRALFNQYSTLYEALRDKLDTYGRTLIWDFDRYVKLTNFSELRRFIIELRKQGMSHDDILWEVFREYNVTYSPNYLASILGTEIPKRIARTALIERLHCETPRHQKKYCNRCGRLLPRHPIFFSRNHMHKDQLSNVCKECEKIRRIARGVSHDGPDLRAKDPTLSQM